MAQQRNSKNSSARTAGNRSGAPRTGKAAAEEMRMNNENISRVVGVIIFALSVIFFFIAVISGDGLWKILHHVYVGVFGIFAACMFPILCIIVSVLHSIKNPEPKKLIVKSVKSAVMVLLAAAFIHILQNQTGADFRQTVSDGYSLAVSKFNGGFLGALIGWLLLTFGKAPAIIVNLVLIFVDFMFLTDITVSQFFTGAAKPAKMVYDKAAPIVEERKEVRKMNKNNIDVPLDAVPPGDEEEGRKRKKQKKEEAVSKSEKTLEKMILEMNQDVNQKNQEQTAKKEKTRKGTAQKEPVAQDEKPLPYFVPFEDVLESPKISSSHSASNEREIEYKSRLLIDTLHSFNVDAQVVHVTSGPTVTRFELKPASGIRISKITNLADDIALNLAATHVRIEAPIPGKSAVGIEIPNKNKAGVTMREILDTDQFLESDNRLLAGLGKDIEGQCVYCDISKMPHLLIAGTTGSGKSVCMNSIIVSILYKASPDEVKFIMIDPKQVEFSKYKNIPHLLVGVVTDSKKAAGALGWAVKEMLERYQKFSETGVRDIEGYNRYCEKFDDMERMYKIVICIDELADLMMAAPKEVEDSICRLAQMARAAGMHLVIATQRPSVDVITGLIKSNISSRIALTVSSQIDSRTILDTAGAEKLLGRGDMLYSPIGSSKPQRVQGCFISDEEVEKLCDYLVNHYGGFEFDPEKQKEIDARVPQDKKSGSPFLDDSSDEEPLDALFEKAVETVLDTGKASTSFLQRKLSVGYARGAKIMDQLQEKGIIGPQEGAKPREILMTHQQWMEMQAYSRDMSFTEENTHQISFEEDSASLQEQMSDDDNDDIIDNQ